MAFYFRLQTLQRNRDMSTETNVFVYLFMVFHINTQRRKNTVMNVAVTRLHSLAVRRK